MCAGGQEERQHDVGHEEDGYQWYAAPQFDEQDAEDAYCRHVRGASQREQDAEGQGEEDACRGDDEGEHHAAPLCGRHRVEAEDAAAQPKPREKWQEEHVGEDEVKAGVAAQTP